MLIKNINSYLRKFVFTRYFTVKKFSNLLRIAYEYKAKKSILMSYPCKLIIDPCNSCVLSCPLCPTGRKDKGRKRAMMKFNDFRKVVDEVKDYLYEIDLYNWGEPLLNKDIFEMIEYAHKNNIRTRISSNLNFFEDDFSTKLVESGLDILIISLDGTEQKTYKTYRRGGDFKKVMANIKRIADEKKRQKSKTPYLVWQFLVMKQNENEIPKVYEMAKELGIDSVRIEPVRTDTSMEIFQSDEEKIEKGKEWLPKDEKLSRFDYKKKEKKVKKKSCIFLWSMPVINPNGSVSPCCAVYPEKYDFGNAFKEGLMKVWNNENYTASRKLVSGKDFDASTVCVNCLKNGFIE